MVQDGAFHLPSFLDLESQKEIVEVCTRLGPHLAGLYQPVLASGAKMRILMMCLGRHWNARTYIYQRCREDVDGLEVQPLPPLFIAAAKAVASIVGMEIEPDIALVNYYSRASSLGLHRDKDEQLETITRGIPVVSISLGDEAEFLFGGTSRKDPLRNVILRSGDAFVFGGKARLCFHGVRRIRPGTGPKELSMTGRINITFRQF
jgi:DNA oxidative demethylase